MLKRREQKHSIKGTVIPSMVATLAHAQRKYGQLQLSEVIEPAITIAHEGYAITKLQQRAPHCFIIQIFKTAGFWLLERKFGAFVKIVVRAKIAFLQNLKHRLTSRTAKRFVLRAHGVPVATFTAMKAKRRRSRKD